MHVGKFRVIKARDQVRKGWLVSWGSRSTTLSFVLHLSLVNAVGLTAVLVSKRGWFGTRTHVFCRNIPILKGMPCRLALQFRNKLLPVQCESSLFPHLPLVDILC